MLFSLCASFALSTTFTNPLPLYSRAVETDGTLSAIDAYKDGATQGRGIYNSAMNTKMVQHSR